MLPSFTPTGMSRPACTMPLNAVAIEAPVHHTISICGLAALIFSICAVTLTSVGFMRSRATTLIDLFSGIARISANWRSPSWPVASVLVSVAMLVQPFMRA